MLLVMHHDGGLDMIFTDYYSHLKETLLFVNQEADTKIFYG